MKNSRIVTIIMLVVVRLTDDDNEMEENNEIVCQKNSISYIRMWSSFIWMWEKRFGQINGYLGNSQYWW